MSELRSKLYALTEQQHGLASLHQTREIGYSRSGARSLVRSPEFERLTDRVIRQAGSPSTDAQRLLAAVLDAGGDAAISHLTAASWWGRKGCSRWPIALTTTRSTRSPTTLATTHEVRLLPATWSVVHEGVPVVRPELLALQLFTVCRQARAERLVDRLWADRLLSGPSIHRFIDQMGRQGRNGTAGLRIYFSTRGDDYVPPASGLENRVKELLEEAGIEVDSQIDSGAENWTGRVDFRHRTLPIVLEVQSEKYHTSLCDTAHDARRKTQLAADGFTVVEVTDVDVWARPGTIAPQFEDAIRDLRRR